MSGCAGMTNAQLDQAIRERYDRELRAVKLRQFRAAQARYADAPQPPDPAWVPELPGDKTERRPRPLLCIIPGCDKKNVSFGLCSTHRLRKKNGQDMFAPVNGRLKNKQCFQLGCDRPAYCKGHCSLHYKRLQSGRPMDAPPRIVGPRGSREGHCKIDGCPRPIEARGLCTIHYRRSRDDRDMNLRFRTNRKGHCEMDGCTKPIVARRLCRAHYSKQRRSLPGG